MHQNKQQLNIMKTAKEEKAIGSDGFSQMNTTKDIQYHLNEISPPQFAI